MRIRILVPAVVALALAAVALVMVPVAAQAEDLDGKAIFMAQKCNMCHGVASAAIEATTKSEKMKGPDLAGSVAEKGADWATKYLKKEVDVNGKKHPKEVKLGDAEMNAMVAWLAAQKK